MLERGVELARQRPLSELEQQRLIQGFEFSHELAWNLLKDYLQYQGVAGITGSRDATRKVLAGHPAVEAAILYGSRTLARHRPASDIDLTLIGSTISAATLACIDAELDVLLLPWMIDLSALSSIRHPALLAHIERVVDEPSLRIAHRDLRAHQGNGGAVSDAARSGSSHRTVQGSQSPHAVCGVAS